MLGTSSWEAPDHIRTLSSRQVWKRWRLALSAFELCVQRLRWYQSIAREPARHAHRLCCWFGCMHFESHDTLIGGLRLHPEANGYAKQLLADLQTLAFVTEWAEQVANVEMEFGDVFCLGSKLNEWFLSLDLRQFRAAFFTQTVAPCRVELSDDEGTTIWKGRMKTTFAHCLMRMDGNVVNVGRRHERSQDINVTHRRERMENQREWQAPRGHKSVLLVRFDTLPVLRQHPNTWQQQKDTTDAWLMLVGFTTPSSTFFLTPAAHVVISSLTTQQNSSAILLLWIFRLPRVGDQCRNLRRCQWMRSLAKDPLHSSDNRHTHNCHLHSLLGFHECEFELANGTSVCQGCPRCYFLLPWFGIYGCLVWNLSLGTQQHVASAPRLGVHDLRCSSVVQYWLRFF